MRFFRRPGRDRPVPEWASFMAPDEFGSFVDLVSAELTARGLAHEMGDGVVTVQLPDGPVPAGLANVAQVCGQTPRADWPQVIRSHFDIILADRSDQPFRDDFEAARSLLKVRIYSTEEYQPDMLANVVSYPLAPGLVSCLTYDLPTTVQTVSVDDAARWPVPIDELFAIGLDAVRHEKPSPDRTTLQLDGATVEALAGDSYFVASRLLFLGDFMPADDRWGAVVSIPHRHALLFHPIRDASVIPAINSLIPLAMGLFRQGPGSITPDLYWWHNGALTLLPSRFDGRTVNFAPPDAFVEVLNAASGG